MKGTRTIQFPEIFSMIKYLWETRATILKFKIAIVLIEANKSTLDAYSLLGRNCMTVVTVKHEGK